MADARHSLQVLAHHLISAAKPLIDAGSSFGAFKRLMARLGFDASSLPPAYAALATTVGTAVDHVTNFPASPTLPQILALLDDAKAVYEAVQDLATSPPPAGVNAGAYAAEIGERLFELLLTDYLARECTTAFNVLAMLHVVEQELVPRAGSRPAYLRVHFHWSELPKVISSPGDLPARVYGWGTPDFNATRAIEHLTGLFLGLNFPVRVSDTPDPIARGYLGSPDAMLEAAPKALELPFFNAHLAGQDLEAAIALRPLPAQGTALPGLVIEPSLPSALPLELQLHPKVKMRLRAGTNAASLLGLTIRPGALALRYPLAPGTPPPEAGIGIGFDFTPPDPVVLLGDPKASRLEFSAASLDLGADFSNGAWSLLFGADLKGLQVVLDAGEGDGFIQKVIGSGKTTVGLPLGIEWSQQNGIRFKGSASFAVALHPHLSLGPVSVDEIDLKVTVPLGEPKPKVTLEIGAGISGDLTPLKFFVRGIGIKVEAVFAPGNAGPLDLSIGFKPPDGVGLSIDGGGFTGGGFLVFDADKGEYAGGLELTFQGVISVRAIGILTTKMPDGSAGFSLLILIVAEFPPIQLSWGFTLLGVGGLLGLNRTILFDALQLGVRDGSLSSILFPRNIVANAPRIINDLKRVFPPLEGRFLIGPMGKLGWGTPTLLSLELGVLLELPRPAFAIVGILRLAVPAEEAPVLYLQVNFAGSVDFDKGQLQFDASLYDSRVLIFPLTGDMAVRLYWKDNPNFLLTVGGFHPAYTPPPMNIGQIARLGIVLFQGQPSVRAESYFAVTSNTLQFGARVELSAGGDTFNVYGFLGLDVLINFNPFHFVAELAAMLAVRAGSHVLFSVKLDGVLEGPTPWHARGSASFEIGFIFTITISVKFDATVGDARDTQLPAIEVLPEMVKALTNLGNWRPRLPPASNQHVSLRELPDASKQLVLHPFGALEVAQKVVPLNIAIQRFGSRTPADGSIYRIGDVTLGGAAAATSPTLEQFAPAQFFAMSDAEKLSRPSFADYGAGVLIGGDLAPRADFMRVREVAYEVLYVPERHPVRLFFNLAVGIFKAIVGSSAVGRSAVSAAARAPSAIAVARVRMGSEQFAVVSIDDMTLHAPHLVFDSATAADQALRELAAARPELGSGIQVVPTSTLPSAAQRLAA
jgi:hypothetical protein